jgi:hypothetical protein
MVPAPFIPYCWKSLIDAVAPGKKPATTATGIVNFLRALRFVFVLAIETLLYRPYFLLFFPLKK